MSRTLPSLESVGQMLSTTQSAELLNVDPKTLRQYARDGLIPCYRIGKRSLRFDRNDLARLITDKTA